MMHKFQLILSALLFVSASSVMASGGFSGGGIGGSAPPRVVDETYERGKSIFKGRADGAEKIKYCVKADGEVKKLKRSTVKPFKNASPQDFALALVDCQAPDRLAVTTMRDHQVQPMLYYLNKRFKLQLGQAAAP